jgi:hypothetical protein
MVDENIRLATLQSQFETDYGHSFLGLTLSETLHKLIFINQASKAQKLKSEFNIPDKRYVSGTLELHRNVRFWYIKIRALAELKDWDGLGTQVTFFSSMSWSV